MKISSAWRIGGIACAALLFLIAVPRPIEVAPPFAFVAVDSAGRPIAGACVSETWQNYTLEPEGHGEEIVTDSEGNGAFRARTLRASRLQEIVGVVRNFSENPVHSSYGNHSWVIAWASGLESDGVFELTSQRGRQKLIFYPDTSTHRKCEPGTHR